MKPVRPFARVAVVAAAALLAAACDLGGGSPEPTALQPRTFEASISMPEWRGPLPLGLIDRTGLVTGVAAADPSAGEGVSRTPDGKGLNYVWFSGACDAGVVLNFGRIATGFELTTHTEVTGEACDALALVHQITIQLAEPIDPAAVAITFIP